jgi:NADH:ubiquinone oxidoreductase subunit F (NADH-binding)/NADH:ubiquinone oxidoreductase subunit E
VAAIVHELTLLQEREGWLSEAGLRGLAERLGVPLHRLESVSSFYPHFQRTVQAQTTLSVCRDLSCTLAGGVQAGARLRRALASRPDVEVREVSCMGRCDVAPAVRLGDRTLCAADPAAALEAIQDPGPLPPAPAPRRWAADPYDRPEDRYGTLRSVLGHPTEDLVARLEESGLRGMGGAGFPTGRKWSLVAAQASTPRYVICNADESEPGSFKDRQILYDLPHLVIEGMLLAAYCVGSERGWIFIRHEYEPERRRLQAEIETARAVGALGDDIFGSGFGFDVEVFVSPGGYILGEETALLECMEDRRGEPRNKPPFPGQRGLWNQPTLMNNVETFAHAVGILRSGVEWWRSLARPGFAGHKFISVSGDVAEPGVVLIPFGSTLGELLDRCGGVPGGRRLAAIAPGGASSRFLSPEALDVAIDFETLERAGSMLGSGAAVFVAEGRDLVDVGMNVTRFFRNESCGKCVPCRVGSEKAVKLIEAAGGATVEVEGLLRELHATMERTSICGLGQVALAPLLSILSGFPERSRQR